jgi:hypothetical protein
MVNFHDLLAQAFDVSYQDPDQRVNRPIMADGGSSG